jgi:hypothetical protein
MSVPYFGDQVGDIPPTRVVDDLSVYVIPLDQVHVPDKRMGMQMVAYGDFGILEGWGDESNVQWQSLSWGSIEVKGSIRGRRHGRGGYHSQLLGPERGRRKGRRVWRVGKIGEQTSGGFLEFVQQRDVA